jgi:hypothetical protein
MLNCTCATTFILTSMDSLNLKAASAYINNLLLARGLLRNGKSVEFARPSKGEGGTEATMAQIINLVHDMIIRRDVRTSERTQKQGANILRSENRNKRNPSRKPYEVFVPNPLTTR